MTPRLLSTDNDALAAYSALLGVTSAPTPVDYLTWLYADNPHGAAVGHNAYDGETLAAHYATIPITARLDGRPARGLLSLNTATHPGYQGKGLFTKLAETTYAHAADQGYSFVVGVANANSTPGFTRKLGFQLVSPLDVLLGLGHVTPSARDVAFSLSWSENALSWRLRRPHAQYVASPSGSIFAVAHKLGILALMTVAPGHVGALPRTRMTQPFRMWIGLDPELRRRGLLAPLPARLRPSPLNLIYRDLTGKSRTLDRDSLRFTLLDFDAY